MSRAEEFYNKHWNESPAKESCFNLVRDYDWRDRGETAHSKEEMIAFAEAYAKSQEGQSDQLRSELIDFTSYLKEERDIDFIIPKWDGVVDDYLKSRNSSRTT